MVCRAVLELLETTTRWELTETSVVGRAVDAEVTVAVEGISRRHLELRVGPSTVSAVDLGSRNGSAVNGELLISGEPRILHDGDVLALAGQVELRFLDPLVTPVVPRIGRLTGVWIDPDSRDVWVDARRIEPPLSGRQRGLIELLYRADGRVVSRDEIVAEVWSDAAAEGVSEEAVAALVRRVRRRMEETSGSGDLISTVRGRGVRLHNSPLPGS